MKDRLQFRAWNSMLVNPTMIYDVQKLNGYSADLFWKEQKKEIENLPSAYQDIYFNNRCFQNLIDTPAWTVMQSTGLKDRNGKLIFEGDILESNGILHLVQFFEGAFGWVAHGQNDKVESQDDFVCISTSRAANQLIAGDIFSNSWLVDSNLINNK